MPDVPNVPGVPILSSYAATIPALIPGDVGDALRSFLPPQWGIYLNGTPVIIPASILSQVAGFPINVATQIAALVGRQNLVPVIASTAEFDYAADAPISNYPQERGSFQSYNKIVLPWDVKMRITCSGGLAQRQAFFSTIDALRRSLALYDLVTPERVYVSCNCEHVDYRRNAERGVTMIQSDLWFKQVEVKTAALFTNTQQPGEAAQQSIGNVQPQDPTGVLTQQFALAGGLT